MLAISTDTVGSIKSIYREMYSDWLGPASGNSDPRVDEVSVHISLWIPIISPKG
jgi:hypothetical protein